MRRSTLSIAVKSYQFSPDSRTYRDEDLDITFSRDNGLKRYLIYPPGGDEARILNFVMTVGLVTDAGKGMAGGAVVGVTSKRLVGLVHLGRGIDGPIAEEQGRLEAFSIDLESVQSVNVERNWRGKPKSLEFVGREPQKYHLILQDLVGLIRKTGNEGVPATWANFADAIKKLNGRTIEV
jgi:hypothetical protein